MCERPLRMSVMAGLLMVGMLGADGDAPSCNASCTVNPQTETWSCTCRWSVPLGLACASSAVALPPGATMLSPEKPSAGPAAPSELIELRGGRFEMEGNDVRFTTLEPFQPGKAYSIPYVVDDGKTRIAGHWRVTQINVTSQ